MGNGFRQDFHGYPVTAGVDTQLEFVVYAIVMSSLAFHVRGLLECPPGDLRSPTDFDVTLARPMRHSDTACFRVPIPNQHTPGNYINALLSTAADLHDEFRVFAHYEAETPWNQISLSSGSTVLEGDLTHSSFKIPVPHILAGRGMHAFVMIAAKKQMAFEVKFEEPTLDCETAYTKATPGYLAQCPTSGCESFDTLNEAMKWCDQTASSGCHGITQKGAQGQYETRTGRWPRTSNSGEISFVRHRNSTLGQILTSQVSVEHPLCLLVNLPTAVANKQHELAVTVQAEGDGLAEYYRAYMQIDGKWTQMDSQNEGVPNERTFTGPMPDTQVSVSFDSEAVSAEIEATETTACSGTSALVVLGENHTTNLDLKPDKGSCVEVALPASKGLYSALKVTVASDALLPPLTVQSEEYPEVGDTSDDESGGAADTFQPFLQVLKLIRARLSRDLMPPKDEDTAQKNTFWSPVPSTGHLPNSQAYTYRLVDGKERVKFQIAQEFPWLHTLSTAPDAAAADNNGFRVKFELAAPHCTFEERVPLGQRVMGKAVTEIGTKEATACYLVALSERELQHSDMISIKLSPSAAASALSVFVQHGSGSEGLGDKLSDPVVANGVATFSYCASREDNGVNSDSCQREMKKATTTVLRVALVANVAEDVTFSIQFHSFGPSCKFPVKADMKGDVEYPMLMGSDNHVCYQVDPPVAPKPPHPHPLGGIAMLTGLAAPTLGGTFSVFIQAETKEALEAFALLRLYGMKPGSNEWVELVALEKANPTARHEPGKADWWEPQKYTFGYGLTDIERQSFSAAVGLMHNVSQVNEFVKSFMGAMQKPSFLSITVDSAAVLGYKIWFEEDINEVELTTSKHSSSFMTYAIVGIVGALAILLVVIVVSTSGNNDTSSYQKIDKDTIQMQTFQTLNEEDEDIIARQEAEGDDDVGDIEDQALADVDLEETSETFEVKADDSDIELEALDDDGDIDVEAFDIDEQTKDST